MKKRERKTNSFSRQMRASELESNVIVQQQNNNKKQWMHYKPNGKIMKLDSIKRSFYHEFKHEN